ncbi:hypothetical protein [Lentzea jiangxiensis]|uniref:Uncharacterized protein n=1 Tax=Lentzea jiangxiensis TaxID=641025 RepID=A0A1H0MQD9_9PSEU|nr:hypothetical protein [Lentzea jiangxiensis]SDO82564.1 hypothetical protein SAMN05421507_10479 [Lentzea jiangxiensis]
MEIARLSLGLLVAVTVPVGFARQGQRLWVCVALSLVYAAYVVFPAVDGVAAVASWLCAGLATAILGVLGRRAGEDPVVVRARKNPREVWEWFRLRWWPITVLLALVTTVLVAILSSRGSRASGLLVAALQDHRWSVVLSGMITAVFVGDDLIRVVLRPLVRQLKQQGVDVASLAPTSAHIGWMERALVFILVAGGQAEAAALAITIKALFRISTDRSRDFTEYYLVGTLTSVVLATIVAITVRLGIGLSPL